MRKKLVKKKYLVIPSAQLKGKPLKININTNKGDSSFLNKFLFSAGNFPKTKNLI